MFGLFKKSFKWNEEVPKVVIVGAGISGLIAGARLTEVGASVTIVESEPQVGGRVYSEKAGHTAANLGAQFFFKCDNEYLNYYLKKAKKFMPIDGVHGALWEEQFVASKDESFFSDIPMGEGAFEDLEKAMKEMQKDYRELSKGREYILDKYPKSDIWEKLDKTSAGEYLSKYHPDVTNFVNGDGHSTAITVNCIN